MIKIAIADDHELFRKSLCSLINGHEDFEVVIEAENGTELIKSLEEISVDLILLDLKMPFLNGWDACEIIKAKFPTIKIMILTFHVRYQEILLAIKKGADGYFSKSSSPKELVTSIRNIYEGGFHFEESLEDIIQDVLIVKENQSKIDFSTRELEIIRLYACEYSGKEIAEKLGISLRTVESHKKNLMQKIGARNFIGVILFALEMKFLSWDELRAG